MFIAVDPGKNVGVATFLEDGSDVAHKTMHYDDFRNFLKLSYSGIKGTDEKMRFIVEDFRLRQDKALAQTGSDMPAPRCIGAIDMMLTMLGEQAMIFWQQPANLKGALKWAGYPELANKPRGYHPPDGIAAYAHGVHRLIDLGLRKHPIFG